MASSNFNDVFSEQDSLQVDSKIKKTLHQKDKSIEHRRALVKNFHSRGQQHAILPYMSGKNSEPFNDTSIQQDLSSYKLTRPKKNFYKQIYQQVFFQFNSYLLLLLLLLAHTNTLHFKMKYEYFIRFSKLHQEPKPRKFDAYLELIEYYKSQPLNYLNSANKRRKRLKNNKTIDEMPICDREEHSRCSSILINSRSQSLHSLQPSNAMDLDAEAVENIDLREVEEESERSNGQFKLQNKQRQSNSNILKTINTGAQVQNNRQNALSPMQPQSHIRPSQKNKLREILQSSRVVRNKNDQTQRRLQYLEQNLAPQIQHPQVMINEQKLNQKHYVQDRVRSLSQNINYQPQELTQFSDQALQKLPELCNTVEDALQQTDVQKAIAQDSSISQATAELQTIEMSPNRITPSTSQSYTHRKKKKRPNQHVKKQKKSRSTSSTLLVQLPSGQNDIEIVEEVNEQLFGDGRNIIQWQEGQIAYQESRRYDFLVKKAIKCDSQLTYQVEGAYEKLLLAELKHRVPLQAYANPIGPYYHYSAHGLQNSAVKKTQDWKFDKIRHLTDQTSNFQVGGTTSNYLNSGKMTGEDSSPFIYIEGQVLAEQKNVVFTICFFTDDKLQHPRVASYQLKNYLVINYLQNKAQFIRTATAAYLYSERLFVYALEEYHTLEDIVERRFRLGLYYDETHLLTLMRQILCELSELHSEHLAHNNLTLNTLAYTPAGQKYKICDFSHTERLYSQQQRAFEQGFGYRLPQTRCTDYTAPELRGFYKPINSLCHFQFDLPSSDMHSLGVCFLYLRFLVPRIKRSSEAIRHKIAVMQNDIRTSSRVILLMLERNPTVRKRTKITELLTIIDDNLIQQHQKEQAIEKPTLLHNQRSQASNFERLRDLQRTAALYSQVLQFKNAASRYQELAVFVRPIYGETSSEYLNALSGAWKSLFHAQLFKQSLEVATEFFEKITMINNTPGRMNLPLAEQLAADHSLGGMLFWRFRNEKAQELFEKSLQYRKRFQQMLKNDNSYPYKQLEGLENAYVFNNLGIVHNHFGRVQQALNCYLQGLHITRKCYQENNRQDELFLATLHNNIGTIYHNLHEYKIALEHLTASHQIKVKLLAADDIRLAKSLSNIGAIHAILKDFDQGEKYLRQALLIKQSVLGEDSEESVRARVNLALMFIRSGNSNRIEEGVAILEQNLKTLKKILMPDSDKYQQQAQEYARFLEEAGHKDRACALLSETKQIRETQNLLRNSQSNQLVEVD